MKKLNLKDVQQYVEQNIGRFHEQRIQRIDNLKLTEILRKKNPYLFKAKYALTTEEIVRGIVDAYISSSEETIFGDWLEGLAIFINEKIFQGRKSGISNIDLEFDNDNVRYSKMNIIAVNGCCYGKDKKPDRGDYFKYCGQQFWEFISGDENLYLEIIEPLGNKAKEKNDDFMQSYAQMINKFTKEFANDFCKDSGEIDWEKLVKFNSAK